MSLGFNFKGELEMKRDSKSMNNKGFSLVELIIVIAIMAILVAVLAPTYLKFVERSRKSTDVSNVAEIVTALQTYAADPMVNQADKLNSGTIAITGTSTPVSATNATNNADKALKAVGITTIGMKSTEWHSKATTITLNVTVNSDGTVKVEDSAGDAKEDVVKGLYE